MSFAWPHLLWLLVLPALMIWWERTHQRRAVAAARPKILRAEAGPRSLVLAARPAAAALANPARGWLCVGLALSIVALARPQWGRLEEPVFDQSREILLAIDLSRSMLTPDVKPSRLDRAKLLIQSLLENLAGERVGLLVFSGTAFLQSPLSADYEILREFLPALDPDFLPQGGSNYGALIEASLQAFGTSSAADRFLVILSDGEATDDDWKKQVEELKKKNIRVIGLGVGTPTGGMIPDSSGQFVKDERGAVVLSRLESATLEELARNTGGVYRDASAWVDLAALVNETIEAGRKGQFIEKNTVRHVERFQWPLALGVWCLMVSFFHEFPVRPRPRDVRLATGTSVPARQERPKQAVKMTVSLLLTLLSVGALYPRSSRAAAAPPPEPPVLARIVGRIAAAESRTAQDWAELGRETATWGSQLQSQQQSVPAGPVRDALAAVDLGSRLDSRLTDWSKLRQELEALLNEPEQPEQQQQQDQQDQDEQQQDQDQQKQDQQSGQQKQENSGQSESNPEDQQDSSQKQDSSDQQDSTPPEQKPPGESAFGDMEKKEEPPPPPPSSRNTQKVGGAPENQDPREQPADPALALPMQKLEQLRNQDSPAQLFQLMEGDQKPAKKTGKDW